MKICPGFVLLLFLAPVVLFSSCKKDTPEPPEPFTSIIWSQPDILHKPAGIGWFSWVTCTAGHAYKYNEDGSYSFDDYCMGTHLDGEWSWILENERFQLDTYYNGVYQYTYEITVVDVNTEHLQTIVRKEGDAGEDNYFEFRHYPR